jgi:hypothetical protein
MKLHEPRCADILLQRCCRMLLLSLDFKRHHSTQKLTLDCIARSTYHHAMNPADSPLLPNNSRHHHHRAPTLARFPTPTTPASKKESDKIRVRNLAGNLHLPRTPGGLLVKRGNRSKLALLEDIGCNLFIPRVWTLCGHHLGDSLLLSYYVGTYHIIHIYSLTENKWACAA